MRIIFMGTPEFAVPCLEMLIKYHTEYSVVEKRPDRGFLGRAAQL